MLLFICFMVSALCLCYPYLVYPVILRFFDAKLISVGGRGESSVSLLFCAYNEEAVIDEKLRNIEALKRRNANLEVLAFDDGSDDGTYEKLAARRDILTVIKGEGRCGKAHGMKRLAALAAGEILVFTDANVILAENSIENLLAYYKDLGVGGVCGTLHYTSGDSSTASVGGLYWRFEEAIKSLESRSGSVMGADGSIFSIRKELYPEFPDTVLDDFTVSMSTIFSAFRLINAKDVVAYEKLVAVRQEEFARKIRIATRAFHTHLYLRGSVSRMSIFDRFKYFSHKIMRWFGGVWLVATVVFGILFLLKISIFAAVVSVAVGGCFLYAGYKKEKGFASAITEILLAIVATQIGVINAMRGRVVTTWQPAKSR